MQDNQEINKIKKKGRPKKINIDVDVEIEQPEKKKRGRKKKEKIHEEVKIKKKRGRKAALKFFSSTIRKKIPLITIMHDNDNAVLHLDITSKDTSNIEDKSVNIDNIDNTCNDIGTATFLSDSTYNDIIYEYLTNDENNGSSILNLYEKKLESRLLQDQDIKEITLTELTELTTIKDNNEYLNCKFKDVDCKENVDCKERSCKYNSFLEQYIDTSGWINKTDIACWWCCHNFDTVPIGIPIDYYKKKYRVKGIFCTFACMLSYNNDSSTTKLINVKTNSMINDLYKKLTGGINIESKDKYKTHLEKFYTDESLFDNKKSQVEYIESLLLFVDSPLSPAPDRQFLKMFGGDLTIEEFRNSTNERKIYRMIEYPMFISRDYMEEVDLYNLKNANKNVFAKQFTATLNPNKLDEKKIEEVKHRLQSNVVIKNSGIDRFIKW